MTVPVLLRINALTLALALLPAGICSAQGLPAMATARFQALDVNQDGVLSKYEYDSDAAFASLDNDRNGGLSAEELQALLGSEEDGAVSAAKRIVSSDLDNNGELSEDELRRSLDFRFQWLDSNKDGNVDLAELQAGMGVPMIGRK